MMLGELGKPRWFVVPNGDYEGRIHLAGWQHSAIKEMDGWTEFAICPRCFAMVYADDKPGHGDQTWAHEQWHAHTDYPIPDEIVAMRESGQAV